MIVLDSNVLSELMRTEPDSHVLAWLDQQHPDELFTSAITVAEILYGVSRLPKGRRRTTLHGLAIAMFEDDFAEHILPFDAMAGVHYARLVAGSEAQGRPAAMADAQIAAICSQHGATLATRNSRDFETFGLTLLNPWDA